MTGMIPNTPSFRLDGRRALVTGAGRGIGLAAAAALAEAGAEVTLCARTKRNRAGAAAIRAGGKAADTLVLDVTDCRPCRCDRCRRAVRHLVNNAGTNRPKPFAEVTDEDFDAVMGLNLRAAFFVAQAVARSMMAAR